MTYSIIKNNNYKQIDIKLIKYKIARLNMIISTLLIFIFH